MTLQSSLLKKIGGVHHAFFSREGGVSRGIYESLNGGLGSQDDASHVAENRARMAAHMRVTDSHFLTVFQIHSPAVAVATAPWTKASRPRADAIVTKTPGLAIGVTAADCGPILFADPKSRVVGAAHAGWKGAFTGVLEATVVAMCDLGAMRGDIVAAIGPLIRQTSYEVGPEFAERLISSDSNNAQFFVASTRPTHFMFDLAGYIRTRLINAGIGTIDDLDVCTYADERFFSYRRSVHRREPDYGRNIHAIALES